MIIIRFVACWFWVVIANSAFADAVVVHRALGYQQTHAVVIGLTAYSSKHYAKLNASHHDAVSVARTLATRFGFQVTLLVDEDPETSLPARVHRSPNAEIITIEHVRAELSALKNRVGKSDAVLFYFAGHGTRDLERNEAYLVFPNKDLRKPPELMPLKELAGLLRSLDAHHTLTILDMCFSGLAFEKNSGLDEFFSDETNRFPNRLMGVGDPQENLDRIFNKPAFQVITAGTGAENVDDLARISEEYATLSENFPEFRNHSPFTGVLLQGLSGLTGLPDGRIRASELGYYMNSSLVSDPRLQTNQAPRYGYFGGSEGEFMFFPVASKVLNPRLVASLHLEGTRYEDLHAASSRTLVSEILDQSSDDKRTKLALAQDAVPHLVRLFAQGPKAKKAAIESIKDLAKAFPNSSENRGLTQLSLAVQPAIELLSESERLDEIHGDTLAGIFITTVECLGELSNFENARRAIEPLVSLLQKYVQNLSYEEEKISALVVSIARFEKYGVPSLRRMLHDPSPEVVGAAARAIGKIGKSAKDAVKDLIRAFEKGKAQGEIIVALGEIGPDSLAAVPAVLAEAMIADLSVDQVTEFDFIRPKLWTGSFHKSTAIMLKKIGADAIPFVSDFLKKEAVPLVAAKALFVLEGIGELSTPYVQDIIVYFDRNDVIKLKQVEIKLSDVASSALISSGVAALEPLIGRLQHKDSEIRRRSAYVIHKILQLNTIDEPASFMSLAIRRSFDEKNDIIRAKLTDILPHFYNSMPAHVEAALFERSLDSVPAVRLSAVKGLEALPPNISLIEILGERIDDPEHEIRDEAIQALRRIGPKARIVLPRFAKFLDHGDSPGSWDWDLHKEVSATFIALANQQTDTCEWITKESSKTLERENGNEAALAVLIGHLGCDTGPLTLPLITLLHTGFEDWQRAAAAFALGRRNSNWLDASFELAEKLSDLRSTDRSATTRAVVVDALASIGAKYSPSLAELLVPEMAKDDRFRERAIRALASFGAPAIGALVDALHDQNKKIRSGAAIAIGLMGKDAKNAAPVLLKELNSEKNEEVRFDIAVAISKVDSSIEAPVPVLLQHVGKNDEAVDQLLKLGKIDSHKQQIIQVLANQLEHVDWSVAKDAADHLGKIGSAAAAAVPALVKAARHPVVNVRASAWAALSSIGGPAREEVPYLRKIMLDEQNLHASIPARITLAALGTIDPVSLSPISLEAINALQIRDNGGSYSYNGGNRELIMLLGKIARASPIATVELVRLLKRAYFLEHRVLAAKQLLKAGEPALEPLINALGDNDWNSNFTRAVDKYGGSGYYEHSLFSQSYYWASLFTPPLSAGKMSALEDLRWDSNIDVLSVRDYRQSDPIDPRELATRVIAALTNRHESARQVVLSRLRRETNPVTVNHLFQSLTLSGRHALPILSEIIRSEGVLQTKKVQALEVITKLTSSAEFAAPMLENLLLTEKPDIQLLALRAIGNIRRPIASACRAVRRILTHSSAEMRGAASNALAVCPIRQAIDGLLLLSSGADHSVRVQSLRSLSSILGRSDKDVIDKHQSRIIQSILKTLTKNESLAVQYYSIKVLTFLEPKILAQALAILLRLLEDGDFVIKPVVMDCLTKIGPHGSAAATSLVAVLSEERFEHRTWYDRVPSAVKALAAIGPAAIPAVLKRLQNKPQKATSWWERWLLWALERLHADDDAQLQVIVPYLKSGSSRYLSKSHAIAICDVLGSKAEACIPPLVELLSDKGNSGYSFNIRASASALGSIGSDANTVVPPLLKAMTKEKPKYASAVPHVSKALSRLGLEGNRALVEASRHNDVRIRYWSVKALGQSTRAPENLGALLDRLRDKSWFVQLQAIRSLERVGSKAGEFQVELQKVLSNPRPELRAAALAALNQIPVAHPDAAISRH